MKKVVAFFEIPAVDFNRAITFYQNMLGIKLTACDWDTEKMAFFPDEDGKAPGAISYAPDFKPSKDGVMISLQVEDMLAALEIAEKNGGKVLMGKTKIEAENRGYFAMLIDSEGNRVGLYSDC